MSEPAVHLVSVCQSGLELQNEAMLTTTKRKVERDRVDVAALYRDSLRYMAWDPERVRAEFTGLDATADYELEAIALSEREVRRVVELRIGDRPAGRIQMSGGVPVAIRVRLDAEDFRDGRLPVSAVRVAGPDAVLSELRLYSSAPAPPRVTVVGDSRGGLIVGVSDPEFRGIPGALVAVSWSAGRASGTTDQSGLVQFPLAPSLPRGQRATLTIDVDADGRWVQVTTDTNDLALGLREVPPPQDRIDLAGLWSFAAGRGMVEPGEPTRVPGHVVFDGLVPDAGVATLWRSFDLPADWVGDSVFLRFDGAYGRAEVSVNGQAAGTHGSGATSFDLDISHLVRPGLNQVSVILTEYTPHSVIDYMSWYAHLSLLGIWREVLLFRTARVHLGAIEAVADWDASLSTGSLAMRFDIRNTTDPTVAYQIAATVTDLDGAVIAMDRRTGEVAGVGSAVTEIRLDDLAVQPWSAEVPRRYLLHTELRVGGAVQTYRKHVGFRRVEVVGNELRVNGAPIRVLGVNRHDARLTTGRALSDEDLRSDVIQFRTANVNVIRTSHYPADPRLSELCDEFGMYLFDQPPICWLGFLQWNQAHTTAHTIPYLLEVTAETLARDAPHPSVIVWDLANESEWSAGFAAQLALARQVDPSRPAIFSFDLNEQVETNSIPDLEVRPELRSYHYPGLVRPWKDDLARFATMSRPVICDEYIPIIEACQRFPHEAFILPIDPGVRDYWVTGFAPFLERLFATPNCIGGMVWSGVDDLFAVPVDFEIGQGPWSHLPEHEFMQQRDLFRSEGSPTFRGDGEWGVLDAWGRPRAEHWHLTKMYSPIGIDAVVVDEAAGLVTMTVRNRFSHRSLSSLHLAVRAARSAYVVPLHAEPGRQETLRLAFPANANEIELLFRHPEGWIVDGYVFPVPSRSDALVLDVLAGAEAPAGGIAELVKRGWLALPPVLHVQSADRPDVPVRVPATLRSPESAADRWRLEGGGWSGLLQVAREGSATVFEYRCRYEAGEPFNAREIGLAFRLPAELRNLWWRREGEWSYYPDDHIGRTEGYASPMTGPTDLLRPATRWADDLAPWGHVDYRSAKRRIRAAGLTDGARSVTVLSDGTQSARVALHDGAPVLHVLDWYGGVRTVDPVHPVWSEYLGAGRRIEPGTEIGGRVRLVVGAVPARVPS